LPLTHPEGLKEIAAGRTTPSPVTKSSATCESVVDFGNYRPPPIVTTEVTVRFIDDIDFDPRNDGLVPAVVEPQRDAARMTAGRDFRWWARRAAIAAVLVIGVLAAERRPNNHHEIAVAALETLHDLIF
jgi:hypothetical protein